MTGKLSVVDSDLDELQKVYDDVRERILTYVKKLREEAKRKLKEDADGEPEGLANNLVTLGLLAFELPTFKEHIIEQMNELLNKASGGHTGVQYLLNLGQFLMQLKDDGGTIDDGTMSRSAVAKRIASEFKQFENVQNMFWNQAVQKMQKAPEECVKDMNAKSILDDGEVLLDEGDLKNGLGSFWDHYNEMLNQSLDRQIQLEDIVSKCLEEVAMLRKRHNVGGDVLDPLSIKESLPRFLGDSVEVDSVCLN